MYSIGLIVLALVGLIGGASVMQQEHNDANAMMMNHVQCVFMPSTHTLTCQLGAAERKLECAAVANFNGHHHLFGIGRRTGSADSYALYPRSLDNATYVTDTAMLHGQEQHNEPDNSGIRVSDPTCYDQLVAMLDSVVDTFNATVGGSVSNNQKTVSFVGEILYSDSTVHKRWLWGYGFGFGYPYYGWYGYGYPYYYYPGYFWGK